MGTRRSRTLAAGVALTLLSGAAVAEPPQAEPSGSAAWEARPPVGEPLRRSGAERLIDGIAAEAQYSGGRLLRILAASRDGLADLARMGGDLLPRQQGSGVAVPGSQGAAAAVSPDRAKRGPDDAELDRMLSQLDALETPPVADFGDRPVPRRSDASQRPLAAAGTNGQENGSAAGARRLLDRLEARGEMSPRATERLTRFTAVLPPEGLESRFASWGGDVSATVIDDAAADLAGEAAEEAIEAAPGDEEVRSGFVSSCAEREGSPSDPLHLVALRAGGGTAASVRAADRPQYAAAQLAGLVSDEPRRLADGSVFMPKLTQRLLGVRTVLACLDAAPRVEQLIGRVIANPNASGLVQAGQTGRIRPGPNGLPELGMEVREGQPLAILEPNVTTVERGQLESQLAELRGSIIRAELELARMRDFPIVPFRTGRMLALRLELDGLRRQRDALIAGIDNHEVLLSPMDGVIAQADTVAGQLAQAGDTLWKIVDPQRMRIEAIAYDEPLVRDIRGAWARTSDSEVMRLAFVGRGLTLTNQGVPLHFEIQGHSQGLGVNTPVAVYVDGGGGEPALVLPKASLVRDDAGRTVVWEHVDGERFVARPVHAEPLNGQQVLVRAGLQENARIVHVGASHFSQIR